MLFFGIVIVIVIYVLLSASHLLGLTVLLDAKSESYFVTPEDYVGFKVKPFKWYLQQEIISNMGYASFKVELKLFWTYEMKENNPELDLLFWKVEIDKYM